MMLKTGLKLPFVKYVTFSLKVAIIDASIKYFTGVARIKFYEQLYTTQMSVFTSIDMIGNFPVKSTYMVLSFGFSVTWYENR